MKSHGIQNCKKKKILKKKNKIGDLTLPGFKTHYNTTVVKTVRLWHKDRHMDRPVGQNREPRDKPLCTWPNGLQQCPKIAQWGKDILFTSD